MVAPFSGMRMRGKRRSSNSGAKGRERLEKIGSTGGFEEADEVCQELEDALTELHDALAPSLTAEMAS